MTTKLHKTLQDILTTFESGEIANPSRSWDRQREKWEKILRIELAEPKNQPALTKRIQADVIKHVSQILTDNSDSPEQGFTAVFRFMLQLRRSADLVCRKKFAAHLPPLAGGAESPAQN